MNTEDNYIFLHVVTATDKGEDGRRYYHIHGRIDKKLPYNFGKQLQKIPGINTAISHDYHVVILPTTSANIHELDEAIRQNIIAFINATSTNDSTKWSRATPLKTYRALRHSTDQKLT